ncbi:MAG: microcystin degradation protein MlrC [Alphaproteobacteria bacterium]|nr:microcystin degradation protein MlrC [Alphaproteobacteria bacterium]
MALIAVGGIQHETNTFAPSKADLNAFQTGGGFPPLTTGPDLYSRFKDKNIPISGFIDQIEALGHHTHALTWGAASPSDVVTEHAYEHICGSILDGLRAAPPYDAIYLCLHGAMVTEHLQDGEGELLRRVRALIGPDIPLVASLDLHCNTTPEMITHADLLVAYRTYPHVDMADTGARTARLLDEILRQGRKPAKAFEQMQFLIPLHWQCTMMQPAQGLYDTLPDRETDGVIHTSFTPGFPAADIHHCGPSVFAYGWDAAATRAACERLAGDVNGLESVFSGTIFDPDAGVLEAMRLAATASRPIVIADTQDNPGAGGDSNTAGMLRALVENRAEKASLGLMIDRAAAEIAHRAGVGAEVNLTFGGHSGVDGDEPFEALCTVEQLHDGRFDATGPFYKGAEFNLGPSACVRIGGTRVVLACNKVQMADQAMYRFVGIEPTEEKILVNKSSVHFRADFAPIAEEILVCAAPGPMIADPADLPWKRLRKGMRLNPLGPVWGGGHP